MGRYYYPRKFNWKIHKFIVNKKIKEFEENHPGKKICVLTNICIAPEKRPEQSVHENEPVIKGEVLIRKSLKVATNKLGSQSMIQRVLKKEKPSIKIHTRDFDSITYSDILASSIEIPMTGIDGESENGDIFGDVVMIESEPKVTDSRLIYRSNRETITVELEDEYQYVEVGKEIESMNVDCSFQKFRNRYDEAKKQMEEILNQTNESLMVLIEKRTIELNQMYEERAKMIEDTKEQIIIKLVKERQDTIDLLQRQIDRINSAITQNRYIFHSDRLGDLRELNVDYSDDDDSD